MSELLIGYARVSTDAQDLTAQRDALDRLGVPAEGIYVDHGLTGTNRDRPGLRSALAVCREGDTLVVTKLDRLARSLPDAREIIDDLTRRHIKLSLGGSLHDPTDPVGRLLFNVLAMVAEFESDLIRLRTREGMKVAKAKGRLRGKQPSSSLAKRRTWPRYTRPVTTAPANWPSCSASGVQRSTGRSSEPSLEAADGCRAHARDLLAGRALRGPAACWMSRPRPPVPCGPSGDVPGTGARSGTAGAFGRGGPTRADVSSDEVARVNGLSASSINSSQPGADRGPGPGRPAPCRRRPEGCAGTARWWRCSRGPGVP